MSYLRRWLGRWRSAGSATVTRARKPKRMPTGLWLETLEDRTLPCVSTWGPAFGAGMAAQHGLTAEHVRSFSEAAGTPFAEAHGWTAHHRSEHHHRHHHHGHHHQGQQPGTTTPPASTAGTPTQLPPPANQTNPPTGSLPGGVVTPPTGTAGSTGTVTASTPGKTAADPTLVTLNLNPLDLNLAGLEVQTNQIQVTISAQPGNGELLGNLLTDVSGLLNLQGVNNALNNVLGSVVQLVNSASLSVNGLNTSTGPLSGSTSAATTPVLNLYVAPVHLNLLGAQVDTSPIQLTITAHSGQGLVLGNVLTDLANLFNPPLPKKLDIDYINGQLQNLIAELNTQLPGIGGTAVGASPTGPGNGNGHGNDNGGTSTGTQQVLSLSVPPLNVNLLGLLLQTSQIQVNANATSGNGDLLGNVLTSLLNTVNATPQNLSQLNTNLNAILAKVVGVLNASSLTLPTGAVGALSPVLQTLTLPNLVNTTGTATQPILNLAVASTDGSTPPVNVNLLGLNVTTSNINAQLLAQTGDGQVLGNLLYNVANLLNPGGSLNLLTILNQLGL